MAKREPASPENRRAPEHAKRRKKSQQDAGRRQEDGKRRVREDQSSKRAQNRARMEEEARLERMRAQNRKGKGGEAVRGGSKKRRKRKRKNSIGKKILLGVLIVLLLLVLAAIGVLASKMSKLKTEELNPDKLSISDELTYDETGYLNVALFGLDTREKDEEMGTRSDTIMIASLNRETKEIRMASLYRDTLLQQDDGTYNKANVAYSFGEEEEAVAMLNRNFDLNIQHYVTVDFSALVDVIDALGGVPIDVKEEEIPYINGYACEIIENTGVDTWAVTEPGLQNLTGVQATAYARIRAIGDDYQRAARQREVLTQIAVKAQQASLSTLNKIIDRVFPKVKTNFKLTEILAYAKDVKKYKLAESTGFPTEDGRDTMDYGDAGNVVVPVTLLSNATALHEYLFGDEEEYVPSSKVKEISDEIAYLSGYSYLSGDDGSGYNDYSGNTDSSGYSDYSGGGTDTWSGDASGTGTWDGSTSGGGTDTWSGDTSGTGTWDGSTSGGGTDTWSGDTSGDGTWTGDTSGTGDGTGVYY